MPSVPPAAITLVVGPEELLADRAVGAAVAAIRGLGGECDVRDVPAGGLAPGAVTELASPSLFGERQVIVLRDVQDAPAEVADELTGFVAAVPDEVHLVLAHRGTPHGRGLLKAARAAGASEVACARLTKRSERVAFVAAEFTAHHRKATAEAMEVLLEAVGDDLRALAGACSQLSTDTTGVIDADAVRRYYAGHAEVKGFAVADRAVEGKAAEALVQLRWALQTGTDPVLVVSALAGAVRAVVRVASAPRGVRSADLARDLGMPPWKVDVVRRQARGWSAEGAVAAVTAVALADAQVKGGGTDPAYAVEKAVVAVAQARAGVA